MVMKAVQQLLFEVDWRTNATEEMDVLVVDMPPGTGDVQLSLGQLVIVDGELLSMSTMANHWRFTADGSPVLPRRCHRIDASGRRFDRR
jgi:hypothetical protein